MFRSLVKKLIPVTAILFVTSCAQKSATITNVSSDTTSMNDVAPQESAAPAVNEQIFTFVEQMPTFPGGEYKMMEFLKQNIMYPNESRENNESGMVIVKFVVTNEGLIKDTKVVRSVSKLIDAEALRVMSLMPRWTPGKQNGQAVNVHYTLPIKFALD